MFTGLAAPSPRIDLSQTSDAELIGRVVRHDTDAPAELFRRHGAAMFAVSCRIARDPSLAEDATQDACVQAWRDAARYDESRGSVLSWLLVIVRGRTLDRLRARQTRDNRFRSGSDADSTCAPQRPVDHAYELRHKIEEVDAALEVLPEADRRTIQLAYYEGLTHTEIAERLDVPLGTAKTHLRRGMQTLRTAVDDRPRRPFQWRAPAAAAASPTLPLMDLNVLVVDDEPDTVKLTTLVLKRAGASVVCAASAQQAMDRLETAWPDMALIDLAMPDMDGYALMTELRGLRTRHVRRLPVAAFTAHGAARDRERTRAAGFDLHFAKPVRPSVLVDGLMQLSRAAASRS